MKFSHREEERAGQQLDRLTNEEVGLRIIVGRRGAELVSLARRQPNGVWVGFLYRDNDLSKPATGWGNHSTLMGYFLHRLKNQRSSYRGHEIRGGTHGFLRHKLFADVTANLTASEGASLTYRISPNEYSSSEYPLKVSMALNYTLCGDQLQVGFHFRSHEPELTAHLQFGLHPGFAATTFQSFQLQMPAGHYRRWWAPGNFLSGETEEIEFAGGEMPFARARLPDSYIVEFVDVPDRTFIYSDPPSGRRLTIDFGGAPYFTLWSDGGPFLCIEPCWGLPDRHEQRPFEQKDGIQTIPPGGELRAGFTITPTLS